MIAWIATVFCRDSEKIFTTVSYQQLRTFCFNDVSSVLVASDDAVTPLISRYMPTDPYLVTVTLAHSSKTRIVPQKSSSPHPLAMVALSICSVSAVDGSGTSSA